MHAAPGNPGIARWAECAAVDPCDPASVERLAREIAADLVVIGGGPNSPVLEWITELGGPVQPIEQESEAGIIYLSRFYRLRPDRELPLLTKEGAGGAPYGFHPGFDATGRRTQGA